jgi:apolipoprotein N-acyltransferase
MSEKAITEFKDAKTDGESAKRILVIWPESPMNLPYNSQIELREKVADFVRRNNVYLIWNTITDMPGKQDFNSVLVMAPNGEKTSQYDKIYLMPFGEYVPFRQWIPFIGRIPALAGEFTAGSEYSLGNVDGARLGASICYEATIPQVARTMTKNGATVLVNISDDGWFGPTAAARQHLAHAIFRSVENNRETLRVTNSGITVRIHPDGNIEDQSDLFQPAVRKWRLNLNAELPTTFYTRHGDLFAIICLIGSIAAMVATYFRKLPGDEWKKKAAPLPDNE